MRYAIDVAPLGPLSDPDGIVRLAVAAEASGWDGISTWDSLGLSMGASAVDPFVALAAVASATRDLRLILSVVALPRRRPQLVAQSAATLDRASHGRLVLGVGSGGDPGDFEPFGESFDPARRAAMLDESLGLIDAWLRGERINLEGEFYASRGAAVGPAPAQRPRPPVWIGGMKPGAVRRAAAWDGWIAVATSDDGTSLVLPPERLAGMVDRLRAEQAALGRGSLPVDVAVFAFSEPGQEPLMAEYATAGATWWLESLSPLRGSIDELIARVEAGPPRPSAATAEAG
jgi:alkanesulfonate monooxygenase SsuD/methylene tetrahydromethanopterin reductase-like flavin-dependent oxidoreductase (luciferase family)